MPFPAKSRKVLPALGLLILWVSALAAQAFADTKPKFVYVANSGKTSTTTGPGTISAYAIDSSTGALTVVPGSPFAAGSTPSSLVVDPSNRFVYVTNRDSNSVSGFSVDSTTGALTAIPGSPFATGLDPYFMAADPKGNYIYVVNQQSNTISAFSIDNVTGALTQINGSPFTSPFGPNSITVDPTGKFAYVTTGNDGSHSSYSIAEYVINASTGALSLVPGWGFYGGPAPIQTAVDPSGKFLYEASARTAISATPSLIR
jgi:YVTN family beta-propeller protein